MRGAGLFALLWLAVLAQVTVAPLFPLGGAVVDPVLLLLCLVAALGGPVPVMVLTPLGAVMAGMLSDRDAGLLLLAWLPVLPLGALLEDAPLPLSHAVKTYLLVIVAGIVARVVLAAGAMLGGAPVAFGATVTDVLLPGIMLDMVALTMCYLPLRAAGRRGAGMRLRRRGYVAGL